MSDDDNDDFMQDSGDEQYDFEYEDDDEPENGDVDIENIYYNAKQIKLESPADAIPEFLSILPLEGEKGDWGFKALKQAVKLEYKAGQFDTALEHYREMLSYVKSAVTRNYSEKSINNMLDFVEKNSEGPSATESLEKFYAETLESFQNTNNERLWLKTNTKLAKLFLDRKQYSALEGKLKELHQACLNEQGDPDPTKGTAALEIYALEIQMYSTLENNKRLKALYQRALKIRSAVSHPRILGIIRECGGKMHMSEENWEAARTDFFESFKSYDEAGSLQRITVLRYLVLTTMLMGSDINPFESQETKPYKTDSRVIGMTELVDAYQREDIARYMDILRQNQDLLEDNFIAENIDEVTRSMRMRAILTFVKDSTEFTLTSAAETLGIAYKEVEDIVSFLIVDEQLDAKINSERGVVEIDRRQGRERTTALAQWTAAVDNMSRRLLKDGHGFRTSDPDGVSFRSLNMPPPGRESTRWQLTKGHKKQRGIAVAS